MLRIKEDEIKATVICCECGSMIKFRKYIKDKNNPNKAMITFVKYYSKGMFVQYGLDGYLAVPNISNIDGTSHLLENIYKEEELDKNLSYVTQKKDLLGFHRDNNMYHIGNKKSTHYFRNYLSSLTLKEQLEWAKWFEYWHKIHPKSTPRKDKLKLNYKQTKKNQQRIKAFAAKKEKSIDDGEDDY